MKSILILQIFFFLGLIVSCNSNKPNQTKGNENQEECVEKIDPACSCMMVYEPVCGCNNKTYSNACIAECSGIKEYVKGECKK